MISLLQIKHFQGSNLLHEFRIGAVHISCSARIFT